MDRLSFEILLPNRKMKILELDLILNKESRKSFRLLKVVLGIVSREDNVALSVVLSERYT